MHFMAKPQDPAEAPSGYEALQDAVAEGNLSLVASLCNLGANVDLQVAVASGHLDIVEYFIAIGADEVSVDNALVTYYLICR